MSRKIDDELAEALQQTEEAPAVANPLPAVPQLAGEPESKRNLGLLIGLLVIVGAVVSLFMVGFKEAAIYATPVDDLVAAKEKLAGRKVRMEGELVPGTLVKRDQPCEYRFTVHGQKQQVPVRYAQCVVPDTFRDVPGGGVQVTVEGTLTKQGDFEATLVLAKCASKYDPKTHQMKDGAAPAGEMPIN